MTAVNQTNKELVWNFWQALEGASPGEIEAQHQRIMSEHVVWHGPVPLGDLEGRQALVSGFWQPLIQSFPDLKRETHLFCGGRSNGRVDGDLSKDGHMWVSGTGYFNATFANDYLDIQATGQPVRIRWGEFYKMENERVVEIYCLLDFVDLMQQAGFNVLPPAKGKNGVYRPPAAGDGVLLAEQDQAVSDYTLDHIRRFIFDGLNAYDQDDLTSMGMADYFHPDVKWYGPAGIGACLSFEEFETLHQAPWLVAFPDRQVQDLDALFGEGAYSGAPGWAGVIATHTGTYLETPATGKMIRFNGLDWWKRVDEQYIENWVFVDMVHLFQQFGIDLFQRMAEQKNS
ncbi:MAG: ester cyclase [Chloroflexota bacterium]